MRYFFNTLSLVILTLSIFAESGKSAASSSSPAPSRNRAIFILLDESEKDNIWGAVSSAFALLLTQKAGPILATNSLVKNVLEKPVEFDPAKNYATDSKSFLVSFNKSDWIIKEVSNNLVLFLPRRIISQSPTDIDRVIDGAVVSETELALGLKVNHMRPLDADEFSSLSINKISDDFLRSFVHPYAIERTGELEASSYVKSSGTGRIFVLNQEYARASIPEDLRPRWTIYLQGHGEPSTEIAGLGIAAFRDFIRLLEHGLTVNALVITTCYSGGKNINEVFGKDASSFLHATYNYPIVYQALTDAPTATLFERQIDKNKEPFLITGHRFRDFYDEAVAAQQPKDIAQLTNLIFPLVPGTDFFGFYNNQYWGNAPQIRLPGLSYFVPIAKHNEIAIIGKTLAEFRDPYQPLNLKKFYRKIPSALLLYAENVNFEIVVDQSDETGLEAIISMIPGDAVHRLVGITVNKTNNSFDDYDRAQVLGWFTKIARLKANKLFYVGHINDMVDVVVFNHVATPLFGDTEPRFTTGAFYKDSAGRVMTISSYESGIKPADDYQIATYDKLYKKALGIVERIDTATMQRPPRGSAQMIPSCTSTCIVDNLTTELFLSDVFLALRNQMTNFGSDESILVRSLTAKASDFVEGVPMSTGPITLENVLVRRDSLTRPYFSYEGRSYHGAKASSSNIFSGNYLETIERASTTASDFRDQLKFALAQKIVVPARITRSIEPPLSSTSAAADSFTCHVLPRPRAERLGTYAEHFPPIENQAIVERIKNAVAQNNSDEFIAAIRGLSVNSTMVYNTITDLRPLLDIAAQNNMPDVVKYLLERGAELDYSPFHLILEDVLRGVGDHNSVIELLISYRAPIRPEKINIGHVAKYSRTITNPAVYQCLMETNGMGIKDTPPRDIIHRVIQFQNPRLVDYFSSVFTRENLYAVNLDDLRYALDGVRFVGGEKSLEIFRLLLNKFEALGNRLPEGVLREFLETALNSKPGFGRELINDFTKRRAKHM